MVPNIVDNTETTTDDEKLLTDSKDKSKSVKQHHLDKLKTKTYIIYTSIAVLATALTSLVSYFTVLLVRDNHSLSNYEYDLDYYES